MSADSAVKYMTDIENGPGGKNIWDAGSFAKSPSAFPIEFLCCEEGRSIPGATSSSLELKKFTLMAWVYSVGYLNPRDPYDPTLVIEARVEAEELPTDVEFWVTIHYNPRKRRGGIVQKPL